MEPLIGMFVNTLPYRTTINPLHSFEKLQQQVKELCLNVMEYSMIPYDMMVRESGHGSAMSDTSRASPFFQLALLMNEFDSISNGKFELGEVQLSNAVESTFSPDIPNKFDIEIGIHDRNDGRMHCAFHYSTGVFAAAT